MSKHEFAATAANPDGAAPPSTERWEEPRARIGLRVDRQTTPPGVVQLQPLAAHRLKIHAGAPVRGICGVQRFLYTRGDIDILPAGLSGVWQEDDPSTSLILQLSPSLLRRTAEDVGADPDGAGLEPRHQIRDAQIEYIAWALDAERAAGTLVGFCTPRRWARPSPFTCSAATPRRCVWDADCRSRNFVASRRTSRSTSIRICH